MNNLKQLQLPQRPRSVQDSDSMQHQHHGERSRRPGLRLSGQSGRRLDPGRVWPLVCFLRQGAPGLLHASGHAGLRLELVHIDAQVDRGQEPRRTGRCRRRQGDVRGVL